MSNGKIKATALNNIAINPNNTPPIHRKIVDILILMCIYIITARIGQILSIPPGNVTPVWIPSGIMLAAVLLRGYWIWPGIFLGAFIGNTWAYFDVGSFGKIGLSVFSGLMNGTGDVLCAVVAAYFINKGVKTDGFFNKSSLMAKFIIFGAILGPLISAIFGVSGLCIGKIVVWNDFLYTFATWFTGDGVGALVITPFLVVVISREYWDYPKNRLYEVIFFTFALIGITFLCATNQYFIIIHTSVFLIVPILLWASFRLGRIVTFSGIVMASTILIYITIIGYGPFYAKNINKTLVELQFFITIMTVTIFMLTSIITERKESGERIRKLSQALHQSPSSVVIADINGAIEYVNPQFTTTTGYSLDEVKGRYPGFLISGKQSRELYDDLINRVKNGYEWRGDLLNRRKDGKFIWELISISPVKNDNGIITNFVAVKIDDTERRIAEEKLQKSMNDLARAQHITHIGNWSWNIFTNEIEWSDEIYNIFGLDKNDFDCTYEAFVGLIHSEDRELVKKAVNDSLYNNIVYSIDHRIKRSDDSVRTVHEQGEVIYNENGKPVGMFGTMHDITEEKRMMEELTKTQKLESLGILAGGIAHDFNNILTAILGNTNLASMLLNDGKRDKVGELLLQVEKATVLATNLTQQLLTFSKGGSPLKVTTSIGGLIRDSAGFAISGTNVQCDFFIANDLWQAEIDRGQINQVFNNIVINAVHAMPNGGRIEIRAENLNKPDTVITTSLKEKKCIKISIVDHGTGIAKEILSKVFDPFFTTKNVGSGLGLASSYTIIKNHNGFLNVESKEGSGTAFYVYLPATLKEVVTDTPEEELPVNGNGKILVMDDDDSIRTITSQSLQMLGYEVKCVKNGEEAISMYKTDMAKGNPFNAVIMDLTIPDGMGGKEAIKILRQIDSHAKAIVFSGYSNDSILAEYKNYGFDGCISKPFKLQELSTLIQKII